ncbi:hypothetical protein [Psychroserpens sp. MEBiC05023]
MKHWKTIVALILMALAIYFKWNWFWALFILLGLINVLFTEEIHFVENIKKRESPTLYWIMVGVWAFFSFANIIMYLQ